MPARCGIMVVFIKKVSWVFMSAREWFVGWFATFCRVYGNEDKIDFPSLDGQKTQRD